LDEKEEYLANSHSYEEVEKILKGNFPKMKKDLNTITAKEGKKFFVDVAKEIGLDSNGKLNFLAQWYGVDRNVLFPNED
ncbi:MAG: hypothetical protein WD512_04370, partial [Candidatus Paceibacterota bacterium]